jgi:hypothetical protein
MRAPVPIECRTCKKQGLTTPSSRGPLRKDCDRCLEGMSPTERETECVVCNRSLDTARGPGRPAKTCSDKCRRRYRSTRESQPYRRLTRHAYEIRKAREAAGQPVIADCAMCGEPVDASVFGPQGDLETGFLVHNARGSDLTGEFFNCAGRYESMRRAQRAQTNRRRR